MPTEETWNFWLSKTSDAIDKLKAALTGHVDRHDDQTALYSRMRTTTAHNRKTSSPALAKGQLWKTKESYIQITDIGKTLVDYRMMRKLGQMRRTQTTVHATMEDYLKTNKARLVEGASRN